MRTRFVIFFVLWIVKASSSLGQSHTQLYEVGVMDMNGIEMYFYFNYEIPEKSFSEESNIFFINKRLSEEIVEIADEYVIDDLIQQIDSIGPRIQAQLDKDLQVKNIKVLEIGVLKFMKSYLAENIVKGDRIKIIENSDIKNKFSYFDLRTEEKLKSNDLSITLKSKFDFEVIVEFNIFYREQVTPNLPMQSLQNHIKDTIIASLRHFELHDMWASKRDTMEMVMKEKIKIHYPETNRVTIFNEDISKEAEEYFREIDKKRHAVIQDLFKNGDRLNFLKEKLASDKKLNNNEIIEIEKEIEKLKAERDAIRKRGKALTYKYKP